MRAEINYIINATYVETNFLEKHIFFSKKVTPSTVLKNMLCSNKLSKQICFYFGCNFLHLPKFDIDIISSLFL